MTELLPERWYEATELAAILGVSRRTLLRSGIPCARMTRRKTLYKGEDALHWLDARKRQGRMRKVG
jgi:hypothetical protein